MLNLSTYLWSEIGSTFQSITEQTDVFERARLNFPVVFLLFELRLVQISLPLTAFITLPLQHGSSGRLSETIHFCKHTQLNSCVRVWRLVIQLLQRFLCFDGNLLFTLMGWWLHVTLSLAWITHLSSEKAWQWLTNQTRPASLLFVTFLWLGVLVLQAQNSLTRQISHKMCHSERLRPNTEQNMMCALGWITIKACKVQTLQLTSLALNPSPFY